MFVLSTEFEVSKLIIIKLYNQTEHAHERGNSREKLDDIRKYENT